MTTASNTQLGAEELADQAAPLDALLVDAALGPLRRFTPDASTAKFAAGLVRQPRTTDRRLGDLAAELARIGVGTSVLTPQKRDRRFTDGRDITGVSAFAWPAHHQVRRRRRGPAARLGTRIGAAHAPDHRDRGEP